MATNRSPRKTRDDEGRRKPWAPPSHLSAPEPPEGYRHRWIRTDMHGVEDKTNVHAKLRQGFEPVRSDEYSDEDFPTVDRGQHEGTIGNGGLMLCRIPEETVRERSEYYGNRTREQMQAVEQDPLKDQHPSMPITSDRRSRVTFGGRNKEAAE